MYSYVLTRHLFCLVHSCTLSPTLERFLTSTPTIHSKEFLSANFWRCAAQHQSSWLITNWKRQLMTSKDGTHSGFRNVVGKFVSHTVQKPHNQKKQYTAFIYLNSSNWSVLVMETRRFLLDTQTESKYHVHEILASVKLRPHTSAHTLSKTT